MKNATTPTVSRTATDWPSRLKINASMELGGPEQGPCLAGSVAKRNRPRSLRDRGRHCVAGLLDGDEAQRERVVGGLHQADVLARRPDHRLLVQRDIGVVVDVQLGGRG